MRKYTQIPQATVSVPQVTEGIDLGDRKSAVCQISGQNEVLATGEIDTTPVGLDAHFRVGPPRRVVIEAGAHTPWVARQLDAMGHEVVVANSRRIHLITNDQRKNDDNDAALLARCGRSDPQLLSPVQMRTEQGQADLAIITLRSRLVGARSSLINALRGQVKSMGGRLPACDGDAFHNVILMEDFPVLLRPAVGPALDQIAALTLSIKAYDRQIATLSRERYPQTAQLAGISGVGPLTALTFVLMVGVPGRFSASRTVGAYFGLAPRQKQSGLNDPQLSITKMGNSYMRQLLVTAAHYVLGAFGPECHLRAFGLRLYERGGKTKRAKRKAVVAVARKLAVLMHRLLVTGVPYDPAYGSGRPPVPSAPEKIEIEPSAKTVKSTQPKSRKPKTAGKGKNKN